MIKESVPVKILVIDDEAAIRHSFSDFLEDLGFEVFTAENGRIGLELIEHNQPQMILVDLRMPELDGLEVLKQSRDLAPDTPKIVISGANRIDDVVQALRYGAWDYLVKPVKDLSILEHTVNKTLEKSQLVQENRLYQEKLEAMVIDRTKELEQANKHLSNLNQRLKKIVGTTQGLSGCVELNRFSTKLLKEFSNHMVASGGSLYFVRENGLQLMCSLDSGHVPDLIKFPLPDHSIFQQVMESNKPILIDDISRVNMVVPSGWVGYTNGSLMAFPIPDNLGNTIGILTLHSKKDPPFVEQGLIL